MSSYGLKRWISIPIRIVPSRVVGSLITGSFIRSASQNYPHMFDIWISTCLSMAWPYKNYLFLYNIYWKNKYLLNVARNKCLIISMIQKWNIEDYKKIYHSLLRINIVYHFFLNAKESYLNCNIPTSWWYTFKSS